MRLQKLGRVRSFTPSKNIIVKTEKAPKIGVEVVDESLKVVGRVFDIIGAVSSPYAVVKSMVDEPVKLLNKPVYVLLSKAKRSKNE